MKEPNENKKNNNNVLAELSFEEKFTLLLEYAKRISAEKNITTLLQLMADLGRKLIIADRCSIWLFDKDTNELWTKVAHGISEIRIPADSGIVGYVVQTNKEYLTNQPYEDPKFSLDVDRQTGYVTKAILAIPLYDNDGQILGVFQAINKMTKEPTFSANDVDTLKLIASYSEKAIINTLLNEEIEKTQKEIIFLMAEIGESRSKETGNHVKRVAEMSALFAKLLGMPEEEIELIRMASPMHDIGKVAIPDKILNKPGKLTREEFDEMKSHTTIGYRLLNKSPRKIISTAATIAHEHHEKWNGAGYPNGLKENEIHIYGRISAIVDVFDALASPRVYKPAWEYEKIIQLFKEEKGESFDPELVDLFLNHIDEFIQIIESYEDV